jgi:hypothetical protein
LRGESVGFAIAREDGRKRPYGRSTHPTDKQTHAKKPGAVSRPGTLREFQFRE